MIFLDEKMKKERVLYDAVHHVAASRTLEQGLCVIMQLYFVVALLII